jgi:predicted secreted Zn-dependent protease
MISLLLALALQAAPAAQPVLPPPATAARSLKDLPNLTISYYDVSGKDMKAISKSIAQQRPKDPATGQVVTGGTRWNLAPSFTRRTTDGVCKVVDVKTEFKAGADLPRLTNEASLSPDVVSAWRAFQADLERDAAAKLWFVHDRMAGLSSAMMGKDCAQAEKDGAAYLATLKAEASAYTP